MTKIFKKRVELFINKQNRRQTNFTIPRLTQLTQVLNEPTEDRLSKVL